jgi:hypothetical protein
MLIKVMKLLFFLELFKLLIQYGANTYLITYDFLNKSYTTDANRTNNETRSILIKNIIKDMECVNCKPAKR